MFPTPMIAVGMVIPPSSVQKACFGPGRSRMCLNSMKSPTTAIPRMRPTPLP